jgi:leucyl aminopeptidase
MAAQAAVEGVLLTRYSYDSLKTSPSTVPVRALTVVAADVPTAGEGVRLGKVYAAATALNRDLANTPHSHLNASDFAAIAQALGADHGFEVEVLDKEQIRELNCGGLLGVNAGSSQPPRLVKLRYRSGLEGSRVAMVGKGIMFDSGGLSLKPSDATHAQMKNDMSGAAAILAAFVAVAQLRAPIDIDGWLMCTDNMPSATAQVLGDVLTTHDGTTVEVIDTDAEGRLVLADGLALATEQPIDAVVTIATLTGSVMRALGPEIAGVFGTDQALVEQVKAAAEAVDEPVWQLPLHRGYRKLIDSGVADIMNVAPLGNPDGIIAALFLSHFVKHVPYAHLDIAGVAQSNKRRTWHGEGCTGFGARLLIELLTRFTPPRTDSEN